MSSLWLVLAMDQSQFFAWLVQTTVRSLFIYEKMPQSTSYTDRLSSLTYDIIFIKSEMLLDLLFAKQGLTVSYEEIASALWPNIEDWSLYALSKEIQRLRDKIKSSGINTRLVNSQRKLGYSLS